MLTLLKRFGTVLATVLSDDIVQALYDMVQAGFASAPNDDSKTALERTAKSQALAAVIHKRYGLAGLATAYDKGVISVADFAMYKVAGLAYHMPGISVERIASLNDEAGDAGFYHAKFDNLSDVTTAPEIVPQMYAYLLSSTRY